MFHNCKKLEYVNIYHFVIKDWINYERLFDNTGDNLKICIRDLYTKNKLASSYQKNYNCTQNNTDNQIEGNIS